MNNRVQGNYLSTDATGTVSPVFRSLRENLGGALKHHRRDRVHAGNVLSGSYRGVVLTFGATDKCKAT